MKGAAVKAYLAVVDAVIVEARREHGLRTPCLKGCCACCSEPLLATSAEARHILDGLPPEQIAPLESAVRWWAIQVAPILAKETCGVMEYRRLLATCPLLGPDGNCRCYVRRPMACRTFFATSHPERCAIDHREHQTFAIFSPAAFYSATAKLLEGEGEIVVDHLGAHLYRILIGEIESGQRQHITTKKHESTKNS
jgi:Fe-S-cluster containining protein